MQALQPFERSTTIVDRTLGGQRPTREEGYALMRASGEELRHLIDAAGTLRDRGHGRVVTFSAKVFVPLTTLCRDYCGYCTFRRDPGEPGARTMELDEVVALSLAGERLGAKEALFSLGDRPEAIFSEHRGWLLARGHRTTLGYLRDACAAVIQKTTLLPHPNPGLMGERDLRALREVSVSMGLMLENVSDRLLEPGAAHDAAPDKAPRRRLATIEMAGALKIPFTTGILIGIGETPEERVDSLVALREIHDRHGHIQEVIVQNFRSKPQIRMRDASEPSVDDLERTIAVARLLLGQRMNLQAPPNLSPTTYQRLLGAGLNDWGGISPLTIDHINPEAPWPELTALRQATSNAGHQLRERLPIYPEYIVERPAFLDDRLRPKVEALVDTDGLVRPELEKWRHSE
jgi:7,8-didemethyl-8-hydroxy-5-deazariboflavin synthase CofG subunit